MNERQLDLELLQAVRDFTLLHTNPDIDPFKPNMRDWGQQWQAVTATRLPVAELLPQCRKDCAVEARDLLDCFIRHNPRLHWEQSYRREDGLVPDAMLAAYGFAEITGQRGPFISDRIRSGIGLWGPHIDYPQHRHQAIEAYVILCGSLQFRFGDEPASEYRAGDVIVVDSNQRHGFSTGADNLLVFYLWQAGDLRQTSRFD